MGETTQHMLSGGGSPKGESRKLNQYIAAFAAGLGAVVAGTILAWTSPVLPQITIPANSSAEFNSTELKLSRNSTGLQLTDEEGSWISSILAIGALILAIPVGMLADLIGRKLSILVLVIPFMLNWLLIIFANGAPMMYAARFFAGVGTGGICVTAPMYIGEIAEASIRGTLGSFFQLFLTVGILFTYVVGAFVNWQVLSIISAVIPIIFGVAFFFVVETPQYLLKKDRFKDAEKNLRWLRGPDYDVAGELEVIQKEVESAMQNKASLTDLVTVKANRKALICSLGLMFFQQFSGINAVIFYTVPIFKSAGSTLDASMSAIIVGIMQVIFTVVSSLLIDKAGRRILLLISSITMGICLIVLGIYFKLMYDKHDVSNIGWLPLLSLVVFIVAFSIGFGPIPWMMMGELFSSECKGIASGIAVMVNWILVFVVTKIFPTMITNIGSHYTFWVFAGFMVAAVIFTFFIIPETKGKSNAQIQAELAQ